MRVIFMGTPDFSVGTLHALAEAGHEVVLAVTQPDKPTGRGGKVQFPPVKEEALALGIPVFQPKKIREPDCIAELRKYDADVMVVIAFGQILPKEVLGMTPYGCINVHASLLPKYRGAAPIQWAVINGEEVSGVTTMQMDEGLDTGDMLLKTEIPLDEKETGESLHDKLADAGAKLCVKTLKELEEGSVIPVKQGESPTEYAKMLDKEMGNINWSRPAVSIERLVRGLNSWPGAYTDWNGRTVKIWGAQACAPDKAESAGVPGTVVRVEKDGFFVLTGEGTLRITQLQLPGKKKMDAAAFLRGCRLREGETFRQL